MIAVTIHNLSAHTSNTTSTTAPLGPSFRHRRRPGLVGNPFWSGLRSTANTCFSVTPRCFIRSSACLVNQIVVFPKIGLWTCTSRPGLRVILGVRRPGRFPEYMPGLWSGAAWPASTPGRGTSERCSPSMGVDAFARRPRTPRKAFGRGSPWLWTPEISVRYRRSQRLGVMELPILTWWPGADLLRLAEWRTAQIVKMRWSRRHPKASFITIPRALCRGPTDS